MSRTKKTGGGSSPIKRYLSFAGGKGKIKFYDKNDKRADEKGNVYLDEIELILLDIKSSISGYNEKASAGISSNLLDPYSVGKEPFVVKSKVGKRFETVAEGLYSDIKDEVVAMGGKFTTNLFALADVGDGEGLQLVRLELNGSGLSPWIEATDKVEKDNGDVYDLVFTISQGQLCTRKKGETVKVTDAQYKKIVAAIKKDPMAERPVLFYQPSITSVEITEDQVTLAEEADTKLQEYFDASGNNNGQETDNSSDDAVPALEPASNTEDNDDLPF